MAKAEPFFEEPQDTNTLTRADLAEALHRRNGFSRGDCAKYVEMVIEEIVEAVVAREDVKLSSFGAFQIRAKRERQGRNPKTGEGAKITARLVVTFKPSNVLRARVNNGFTTGDIEGERKGDGAANGEGATALRDYDGEDRRRGTLHVTQATP